MAVKSFDVERVRQNWDRAARAPEPKLPERFARVPVARDPYPEAQRILERVQTLSRTEFAQRLDKLQPFLTEASELLVRLRATSHGAVSQSAGNEGAAPELDVDAKPADPAALRADLLKVLDDLQDLFEVYSGIGLR